MDYIYELLRAGTTSSDSDSGSELARKINSNFQNTKEKFEELDKSTVQTVLIDGTKQSIEDGVLKVLVGTDKQAGVVKSSNEKNFVSIKTDGTMEVVSLNVDKLVQDDGDYIILDGNCN